jgi:hypothetical protein
LMLTFVETGDDLHEVFPHVSSSVHYEIVTV